MESLVNGDPQNFLRPNKTDGPSLSSGVAYLGSVFEMLSDVRDKSFDGHHFNDGPWGREAILQMLERLMVDFPIERNHA